MPQPCVLLKYGELALKGRNRGWFERNLLRNLKHAMARVDAPVRIRRRGGVLVVSAPISQHELVDRAREVMGISVVQPALRVPKTADDAAVGAVRVLQDWYPDSGVRSFAIKARRRNKDFALTSEQLAAHVGQAVRDELGWTVDLGDPDVKVAVEVDQAEIFVAVERFHGQGGLPVGSSGRALALLSGGFDSPVAAYRAMRRGLRCEFVHFTGAPYTGPSSTYKAYALVRQLSRFQDGARLHVVAIGQAQRALATAGAGETQIVAQRRFIVRAAEVLARRMGAQALVTGDSLGQVSSQTLANLATTEQACGMPLLRPLLAWDKEEIVAEARRIDTFDISTLPDEDCCTVIMPPRVATHTTPEQLTPIEGRVGMDTLIGKVLGNARVLTPEEPSAVTFASAG